MTAVTTDLPIVYLQDESDLSTFDYTTFPGNFSGECFLITETYSASTSEQSIDSSSTYGIEIIGAGLPEPVSPANFQAFTFEQTFFAEEAFEHVLDESTLQLEIVDIGGEDTVVYSLESDVGSWIYESEYHLESDSVILVETNFVLESDSKVGNEDKYSLQSDTEILVQQIYSTLADAFVKNSASFNLTSGVNKIALQAMYSLACNAVLLIEQIHSLESDASIIDGDMYNLESDATIAASSVYRLESDASISKFITFTLRSSAKIVSQVTFSLTSDANVSDPFDTFSIVSDARIVRLLPDGSTTTYNEQVTASPIQYDAKVKEDTLLKIYRRPYL